MRVNIIKEETLRVFAMKHSAVSTFENWIQTVRNADWNEPNDLKSTFNSVDVLGKKSHRVVFDIGGNNYRVICKYVFGKKTAFLYVLWLGTHAEYDALSSGDHQYIVENYKKYL